jgi:phosphoserine phosphatase RsbU/P
MKEKSDASSINQMELEIQRLKIAVEELSVLNDLAIASGASTNVDHMLDIILSKSIKAVKADQGSISLVTEQEENSLRTLIRHTDQSNERSGYHVGEHITGWVLKHKQPLMIEKLATDERFQATDEERKKIRSVLCVPIWSQAKIIGILLMSNKKNNATFDSDDLRLLSIIASQSGQLIRNSQLASEMIEKKRIEHELALARKIQLSLLPASAPALSTLDIACYFKPAVEVGGDYYDFFMLDENHFGILIMDVSGHGAAAAMMTTMIKGIFHTILKQFVSVDQTLGELNSMCSNMVPRNIFITSMILVFDLEKNSLTFSNAGHNPLILYSKDSGICQLHECPGPALNINPQWTFSSKTIELKPQDVVVVYTDGLVEAMNNQFEMFNTVHLTQSIEHAADKPVDCIIENIKKDLYEFTGTSNLADDVLVVGIKIKG